MGVDILRWIDEVDGTIEDDRLDLRGFVVTVALLACELMVDELVVRRSSPLDV